MFVFFMSPSAVYYIGFKGFQECFEFPIFLVLEHATAVIKIDYTCKKRANAIQTVYTRKNAALNISHMKLSAAVLYRKTLSYCIYIERAPPRMTLASFKSKSVTAPRRSFKKKMLPCIQSKGKFTQFKRERPLSGRESCRILYFSKERRGAY